MHSKHSFIGRVNRRQYLITVYIGKNFTDCAVDRLNGHSTLEKY
jgi:hypothetical protein